MCTRKGLRHRPLSDSSSPECRPLLSTAHDSMFQMELSIRLDEFRNARTHLQPSLLNSIYKELTIVECHNFLDNIHLKRSFFYQIFYCFRFYFIDFLLSVFNFINLSLTSINFSCEQYRTIIILLF